MTSLELKRYRSGLPNECLLTDIENFYRCMEYYKITGLELEMAKAAYCVDPTKNIIGYGAMARKLPQVERRWVSPVLPIANLKGKS